MKIKDEIFYRNNWEDVVHYNALKEVLKKIADIDLSNISQDVDTVDTITIKKNSQGEDVITLTETDKNGQKLEHKFIPEIAAKVAQIVKQELSKYVPVNNLGLDLDDNDVLFYNQDQESGECYLVGTEQSDPVYDNKLVLNNAVKTNAPLSGMLNFRFNYPTYEEKHLEDTVNNKYMPLRSDYNNFIFVALNGYDYDDLAQYFDSKTYIDIPFHQKITIEDTVDLSTMAMYQGLVEYEYIDGDKKGQKVPALKFNVRDIHTFTNTWVTYNIVI